MKKSIIIALLFVVTTPIFAQNKTSKLKRRNAETETIVKSKTEVRPQNTETAHYFTQKKHLRKCFIMLFITYT